MGVRWGRILGVAALVALACAATCHPEVLELDRSAVARGEWWRMWTGHLVHGTIEHLRYDLIAAVALGLTFGGLQRLMLWAPVLSAGLLTFVPDLEVYYGLSGLLHGWLVFEAGRLITREGSAFAWTGGLLAGGALLKAGLETALGTSLFTDEGAFGGQVLHASHFLGALLGGVAWALAAWWGRAPKTARIQDSRAAREPVSVESETPAPVTTEVVPVRRSPRGA